VSGETLARIELELLDPARNAKRFYALAVTFDRQLTLFPEIQSDAFLLIVARGRLGKRPVIETTRFVDLEPLAARWNEILKLRKRHGYVITREEP
jgi:predicted DNA-binding WGR domain protein